jgi:tRNA(Ile)-lysidine synthase
VKRVPEPPAAIGAAFESGLLPAGSRLLLAVSGGPDSMALLQAFHEAAPRFNTHFAAGHVDHGWRGPASARDAQFVQRICVRLGVPFLLRAPHIERRGRSREAAARQARYDALSDMAAEFGASGVVTAHTRDDAAETILLALLRGRPLAGLAGVRPRREDGILRPLLTVPRSAVLSYLARRKIPFRRDPSNRDESLDRNWVRRRLMPVLEGRLRGAAAQNLAASAEALERDREWLDEVFRREVLSRFTVVEGGASAPVTFLAALPAGARRRALLVMAAAAGTQQFSPTRRELLELEHKILSGKPFRLQAGRQVDFRVRRGVLVASPMKPGSRYKISTQDDE